jgi:16S rRNA (guanine966-N2)-methyltransferase
MKVIGGTAKGRKIHIPKGARLRATSDRTKEALFNILPCMEGICLLDLFAGTGNVGIEALSRGAAKVVFVEKNPILVDAIKYNLHECGFTDNYEVLRASVEAGVRILERKKDQFDIIFADPPYIQGFVDTTLRLLGDAPFVTDNCMIVVEHSFREEISETDLKLVLCDSRRYGDSVISFYEAK